MSRYANRDTPFSLAPVVKNAAAQAYYHVGGELLRASLLYIGALHAHHQRACNGWPTVRHPDSSLAKH
jgi:hypothetical protein